MIDSRMLQLEKLIGKSIEEASKFGNLIKTPFKNYTFKPSIIDEFLDVTCGNLQIYLDTDDAIESITIPFNVILNKDLFDEMVKIYGFPNSILVKDRLFNERKDSIEEEFNQNLTKRVYSMKDVSFEEKPFFIIRYKENFQIKIRYYYEHDGTQLVFRKPTERF